MRASSCRVSYAYAASFRGRPRVPVPRAAVAAAAAGTAPGTRIRYSKRPNSKEELFLYTIPPPKQDGKVTNLQIDEVYVDLQDLRRPNDMRWQSNGFELIKFPEAQEIAWDDATEVEQLELSQLLLKRY